jgi:hypothetical protein
MFKALASLAICMIGGALLLAWLEPTPQDYATGQVALTQRPDARLLRSLARRVVRSTEATPGKAWSGVEVVALAEGSSGRAATLTATAPLENLHFLVARNGQFRSLPSWQRQQPTAQRAEVIRIGLAGTSPATRIPAAQWTALRALLLELAEQTGSTPGSLPIHLAADGEGTDAEGSPFVQHLRDLLTRGRSFLRRAVFFHGLRFRPFRVTRKGGGVFVIRLRAKATLKSL